MILPDWYDSWRTTDYQEERDARWRREDEYEDYLAEESDLENSEIDY